MVTKTLLKEIAGSAVNPEDVPTTERVGVKKVDAEKVNETLGAILGDNSSLAPKTELLAKALEIKIEGKDAAQIRNAVRRYDQHTTAYKLTAGLDFTKVFSLSKEEQEAKVEKLKEINANKRIKAQERRAKKAADKAEETQGTEGEGDN